MNILHTPGTRDELLASWGIDETRIPHAQWALGFGSLITVFSAMASLWAWPVMRHWTALPLLLLAFLTSVLRWRRAQLEQEIPVAYWQWVKTELDSNK